MSGTPAKKAVPSLASLTGKDKEENKTPPVEENESNVEGSKSTDETPDDPDKDAETGLSKSVVSTMPNKTPAELSAESPDETAARYNVDTKVTKEDAENPRVQVYKDTVVRQVPSGTHLHPDIAKDLMNRGISQNTTDSAQVSRTVTETFDFAPDAEHNDKFKKPSTEDDDDENKFDRDEDYNEDEHNDPFMRPGPKK